MYRPPSYHTKIFLVNIYFFHTYTHILVTPLRTSKRPFHTCTYGRKNAINVCFGPFYFFFLLHRVGEGEFEIKKMFHFTACYILSKVFGRGVEWWRFTISKIASFNPHFKFSQCLDSLHSKMPVHKICSLMFFHCFHSIWNDVVGDV